MSLLGTMAGFIFIAYMLSWLFTRSHHNHKLLQEQQPDDDNYRIQCSSPINMKDRRRAAMRQLLDHSDLIEEGVYDNTFDKLIDLEHGQTPII